MIIIFFILSSAAFLIGFLLGLKRKPIKSVLKPKTFDEDLIKLQKEYENFLNYDGTDQLGV